MAPKRLKITGDKYFYKYLKFSNRARKHFAVGYVGKMGITGVMGG
jgi:hypothetical protein